MKKMFWLWIVGLGLFLTMVTLAQAPPNPLSVAGFAPITDYVPNQVLVLVNPNKLSQPKSFAIKMADVLRNKGFDVTEPYDMRNLAVRGGRQLEKSNVCGRILLTVTSLNLDVDTMLERVDQAVRDFITVYGIDPRDFYMIVPNDAFTRPDGEVSSPGAEPFTNLNGLTSQVQGVKVAVIDTGFFIPTSTGIRLLPGIATIQDSMVASSPYDTAIPSPRGWKVDHVKIVDDTPRYENANVPPRPTVYGHGTPVLGIIADIARGATFIPIKACNDLGYCTGKSVTLGLCYAAYQRANVINASFGGFYNSPLVLGAVRDVIDVGGLIVAGAGNSRNLAWHLTDEQKANHELRQPYDPIRGWNKPIYPAAWSEDPLLASEGILQPHTDGLLSVGSIPPSSIPPDLSEKISNFSTLNNNVDVVTYGENIKTNYSLNEFFTGFSDPRALRSGTSFAAPVISGMAAVLKSTHPRNSPGEIENIIVSSGDTKSYECLLVIRTPPQPAINECRTPDSGSSLPRIKVKKLNFDGLRRLLIPFGVAPVGPGRPSTP